MTRKPLAASKMPRLFCNTTIILIGSLSLGVSGCRDASSALAASNSADAASLSGPAVFSAFWGTRLPRVCAPVTTPPNAAQAAVLIQCHMDHATREDIYLMQNIQVQMSGTHQVGPMDGVEDNIDNSVPAYDLTGSHEYYDCAPINEAVMHNTGKNCFVTHSASTGGECWRVHDGTWHCELQTLAGPNGRAHTDANQPGPTTY
jgi:hypothetical protein